MKFFDYFQTFTDYEIPYKQDIPFDYGNYYQYVSYTLLNGVINYVDILQADVFFPMEDISAFPSKTEMKKRVDDFNSSPAEMHTDFGQFEYVSILAYEENTHAYWHFFYDADCSDCCIGRFKTDDSKETVLSLYREYLKNLPNESDIVEIWELNKDRIIGWKGWK